MSQDASLLANTILHLTANNAGPFTGQGTNTYLVGHRTLAVIDPGPHDAAHTQAILAAAHGRTITHILLTHAHRDHVDGVAALKQATGAVTVGFGRSPPLHRRAADAADSPSGGDFVDTSFAPDICVADGARLEADGACFEAIHTPGHAPDHLCYALLGCNPILFSGDHVMGWSTSVIAPPEGHMGDYLSSLERLLIRSEQHYLPGHGPAITDGPRTARAYLLHRQMRERAVVAAVRGGAATIPAITAVVYDGIAPNLLNAARLSVQAHVELLVEKRQLTFGLADRAVLVAERVVAERPA